MMMARRKRKGLSERQQRILQVLESYLNKLGYPPSIREICEQTAITSTSVVNYYLDQLQEMGYIERDSRVSRGIRLMQPISEAALPETHSMAATVNAARATAASVKQSVLELGHAMGELLQIPVVGRIMAGSPLPLPSSDFSYFDAESMVDVASSLLPSNEHDSKLFALEVQGDSMIDAMIYEGDIVIMKQVQSANKGEMVAVWLLDQEETTLKYYYPEENGRVRLQPANPRMKPIFEDSSNVQVQGKVVMVIRQIEGLASKDLRTATARIEQ